jgi:hypothetical protein
MLGPQEMREIEPHAGGRFAARFPSLNHSRWPVVYRASGNGSGDFAAISLHFWVPGGTNWRT